MYVINKMDEASVQHVVADAGAFIRRAPLRSIGRNIYTLSGVVAEIKDKALRQELQVLPYKLNLREPSTESIKTVTDFSKKTGDYPSLSAVDLRVLALAYQLEKEHVGTEHIRQLPEKNITWTTTKKQLEKATDIAGFYWDKKATPSSSRTVSETQKEQDNNCEEGCVTSATNTADMCHDITVEDGSKMDLDICDTEIKVKKVIEELGEGDVLPDECLSKKTDDEATKEADDDSDEFDDDESDDDDDDDSDDDGDWITPGNIKELKNSGLPESHTKAQITVGCLTTDFAVQNVLIQMGLNVISCDGMLIKHAKNFVLRCSTCFKLTTIMMKEFCHHCGNKTLQKVSMTIGEDGSVKYFLSRRKPITRRGLKYSLPRHKGGKHANNPILFEDQNAPQQRLARKAKEKYNVMDADYITHASPFAPIDTTSRSAQLGIRDHRHAFQSKRNPNENKGRGRRKKK